MPKNKKADKIVGEIFENTIKKSTEKPIKTPKNIKLVMAVDRRW